LIDAERIGRQLRNDIRARDRKPARRRCADQRRRELVRRLDASQRSLQRRIAHDGRAQRSPVSAMLPIGCAEHARFLGLQFLPTEASLLL
jgi:hypothetical protein